MATQSFATTDLPKRGDRDGPGETRVRDVQAQLAQLALTDNPPNGVFDASVATALCRFQWYLVNRPWRLHVGPGAAASTGLIEAYPPGTVGITGACDRTTADTLKAWTDDGYLPTTSLVRLNLARLTHCERGDLYSADLSGRPSERGPGERRVCRWHGGDRQGGGRYQRQGPDQSDVPRRRDRAARRGSNACQEVTASGGPCDGWQFPRRQGDHHGRDDEGGQGEQAGRRLYRGGQGGGSPLGSNFSSTDPIHFDDPIASESEDYAMHYFFCQRSYRNQHPMRTA